MEVEAERGGMGLGYDADHVQTHVWAEFDSDFLWKRSQTP